LHLRIIYAVIPREKRKSFPSSLAVHVMSNKRNAEIASYLKLKVQPNNADMLG